MTLKSTSVSVDDNSYDNFIRAYNILNMEEGIHWQSFQADEYTDAAGDSISGSWCNPAFAQERYDTCFAHPP